MAYWVLFFQFIPITFDKIKKLNTEYPFLINKFSVKSKLPQNKVFDKKIFFGAKLLSENLQPQLESDLCYLETNLTTKVGNPLN